MFELNLIVSTVFSILSDPFTLLMVFVGTFMGLTFGTLPGLTATMGIALMIPLTYVFDSVTALGMLIGIYVGGIAGGAVASILLKIPGTPNALVTTFDGYPMARQGRGAEAMGWAAVSSGFGGVISWFVLVFLSSYLARLCVSFSSPEYAALALLGLTIVAAITSKNIIKAFTMLCLGIFISMIGTDPIFGAYRFTYNNIQLMAGLSITPVIIGLYSLPQVLNTCTEINTKKVEKIRLKNFFPSLKGLWDAKVSLFVASIIGTFTGVIRAVGGGVATFFA